MNMILLSGCFLIVWATFKWKIFHVIWDKKVIRACSYILGLYNIFLAIWNGGKIKEELLIIDFSLYFIFDIIFFIIRLKEGRKGIMKIYQLGIGSFFIIAALCILCFDLKKIYVGVAMLTGAMMMISTPFQEGIEMLGKGKK